MNLESLFQQNWFLVVAVQDLNAKSNNRYCQEKISFEGKAIVI